MYIKDYCNVMEMKLTASKAKLFDAIRKTEKMSSKDKEKAMANINYIKNIILDMEAKIDQLKTKYSSECGPQKKKIDAEAVDMRSKYEKPIEFTGKATQLSVQC